MDALNSPVCLSQYFVNKQNVRSFGNIIKGNVLKKKSEVEYYDFFLKEDLVSDLPANFRQILSTLKNNLANKSKYDFKDYFNKNQALFLQPIDKEYVFINSWKVLSEIIPRNFFGGSKNFIIMKNFVRDVIYSMKKQHFNLKKVIGRWDVSVLPWKDVPNPMLILYHLILCIFKNIMSSIICLNFYVTTCKLDANENKLYYYWKNQWQCFYDKQIYKMTYTRILQKSESYSLGKKSRKKYSLANKIKLKIHKKDIPKLYLTLKPNNDFRPIVCYKSNPHSTTEKNKIKERLRFLKSLIGRPSTKIETLYNAMYTKWTTANKPKLYFIKTDLSNAFGSINREKLAKILSERYTTLLKAEPCANKKKRIVEQYKDVVTELCKPILIRAGSTVYEWKEGLVQGYKYSPALSDLYYSYLDEIYFSHHLSDDETHIKLFTRVVDDYLYVTDSHNDAILFLNALSNYRNVNYAKTVINFSYDNIKFSNMISFLGYYYDTTTMQVGRANNIYEGQMCYKIAFTSGLADLPKFIKSRIGQSGIQIESHIFNLFYNSENLIWKHIFTTFCLSANKFCTILAILCDENEMKGFLQLYKMRVTVKLTNSMLETLMRNKSADLMFVYCINHFRYLSWKALSLCAKLTPKCSGLVPLIHEELAKSNCIFGVWREHARRIDTNGALQRKAIKEVCRRNDLRKTFRDFEKLPLGFECYHHKKIN